MIEVQFRLNDEKETYLGHGDMPHTPRVGEYIWLQNKSHPTLQSLRVVRVAYWVPNQEKGYAIPCVSAVAYVKPVQKRNKK